MFVQSNNISTKFLTIFQRITIGNWNSYQETSGYFLYAVLFHFHFLIQTWCFLPSFKWFDWWLPMFRENSTQNLNIPQYLFPYKSCEVVSLVFSVPQYCSFLGFQRINLKEALQVYSENLITLVWESFQDISGE